MFPENLKRLEGIKINCCSRDQSLSDLLYILAGNFEAGNSLNLFVTFAGNSALLPSDVIDFAMFPAHRFWRETVSLLGVL